MQVLPVGYTSNQPFKNNMLQILPKKQKEWKSFQIPIDSMITQREQYYKQENKRLFDDDRKKKDIEAKQEAEPIPKSEAEREADEEQKRQEEAANDHIYKYSAKNIFRLAEYDFPHCVCILDTSPSDNSLLTDYMKISEELKFESTKDVGLTIILHKDWMFVAPLIDPYMTMENGMDLFIDPFSYAGVMNIHIKGRHEWPQAAGIDLDENSLFAGDKNVLKPNLPTSPKKYPMSIVIQNFQKSCSHEKLILAGQIEEQVDEDGEGENASEDEGANQNNGEGDKDGEGEDDEE